MKTDKNLVLYLLTHCTLAIVTCLSALKNSIAQPHLLLENKQAFPGKLQLKPVYNSQMNL
jgi:hypothetical protein